MPNGSDIESEKFQYKLNFLEDFTNYISNSIVNDNEQLTYIGGDYNVASEKIDVYDPTSLEGSIGFHIKERKKLWKIINSGLVDTLRILSESQAFSWWDYRGGSWPGNRGMRIDYILSSPKAMDLVKSAGVYKSIRGLEQTSDHAPIYAILNI